MEADSNSFGKYGSFLAVFAMIISSSVTDGDSHLRITVRTGQGACLVTLIVVDPRTVVS